MNIFREKLKENGSKAGTQHTINKNLKALKASMDAAHERTPYTEKYANEIEKMKDKVSFSDFF
tara:strand:+ start:7948 stop:8136 length:189 start_codon:yes stop_codon:yes gene_type:complete